MRTELPEDERRQILESDEFRGFFEQTSKVIERALAEKYDFTINYTDEEAYERYQGIEYSMHQVILYQLVVMDKRIKKCPCHMSFMTKSGANTVLCLIYSGLQR
jgi:hypothetical protein